MPRAERFAVLLLLAAALAGAQTPPADSDGAQLGVAAQLLQKGNTDQAIAECKSVLAKNQRSAPAHMLLGMAYRAQGSPAMIGEAKAELQEAIDLDPSLVWARFYLARLYLDQGMNEKARDQLETALKQSPGVPTFLSLLGEVRRKLGDPAASLELNRQALAADPTMIPAHYFVALAYLDLKQEQSAVTEFELVVHSPYVTPEVYNALAALYIKEQRFADAEDLCHKSIAMDPSRPDAYIDLARIYNARHAADKALEVLNTALPEGREFPASAYYQGLQADAAMERGVAWTDKKMYAQAIAQYTQALNFDPQRAAVIHRRLAELYLKSGDPARAAIQTKEADKLANGQK